MASLCPLSISFSCPFSAKPSPFLNHANRKNHRPISKATNNENAKGRQVDTGVGTADLTCNRRNALLAMSGAAAASNLSILNNPLAKADPIAPPDIKKCGPPRDLPSGAIVTNNCCPPPWSPSDVKDYYKLPPPGARRQRPAAHLATPEYIEKFSKAVEMMKALPKDDPRNFMQQANVHCAYCNDAYTQATGDPNVDIQVHYSWLFFPFHRWELYFYERILGKLIGDHTFALPFWNWDNPDGGMVFPALYLDPSSHLYNEKRNQNHLPPTLIDLGYNGTDNEQTNSEKIKNNLAIMYRQMVTNAATATDFFGKPYRAGDEPKPGAGTIETKPHICIHRYVGDPREKNGEDMGSFYSAARDLMFFGLHANADRMWTLWRDSGGSKRTEFSDPDWLNASFIFYDENARPAKVRVRDCLNLKSMGYSYQEVEIPWRQTKLIPRVKKSRVAFEAGAPLTSSVVFPLKLSKDAVKVVVKRPKKSRSKKEKEKEEERLVLSGIAFDMDAYVKFDVFINDEDGIPNDFARSEYVGSFAFLPHGPHGGEGKGGPMKTRIGSQTFVLTEILEELGAEDDDRVLVTLRPKSGGDITIDAINIECSP